MFGLVSRAAIAACEALDACEFNTLPSVRASQQGWPGRAPAGGSAHPSLREGRGDGLTTLQKAHCLPEAHLLDVDDEVD